MTDTPKFLGKLTRGTVKTFLTNLTMWGASRNISSQQLKFQLPLSFLNEDANRWFGTNMGLVYNENVTFEQLCNTFLEEAPFGFENDVTLSSLQSQKQGENETTSSFILRIIFEAGDVLYKATESSWVDAFVRNMYHKVSDYIDIRGRPDDIAHLKALVREYELNKDSRPVSNECSHQDMAINDFKITLDLIRKELAEIRQSIQPQATGQVNMMRNEPANFSLVNGHLFDPNLTQPNGREILFGGVASEQNAHGNINQIKFQNPKTEGKFKHSPLLNVCINGYHQEALMDSGANCSLVGLSIATGFTRMHSSKITISSVTNFPIQTFGIAVIPVKIGNSVITFPFVVVEDTTAKLVLGFDFMKAVNVTLNMALGTVTSPAFGTVKIQPSQSTFLEIMNISHLVKVEKISYRTQQNPHKVIDVASEHNAMKPMSGLPLQCRAWQHNTQITQKSTKNHKLRFNKFCHKRPCPKMSIPPFSMFDPGVCRPYYIEPNFSPNLHANFRAINHYFSPG